MALSDNVVFIELPACKNLDDMLKEYDMKRDSVEINYDSPQWSHHAVWNRNMEPKPEYTLEQLWTDSEPAISKETTTSYDVQALGTPAALKAPPQTDTLSQRALEEWERTLCENKVVAILIPPPPLLPPVVLVAVATPAPPHTSSSSKPHG